MRVVTPDADIETWRTGGRLPESVTDAFARQLEGRVMRGSPRSHVFACIAFVVIGTVVLAFPASASDAVQSFELDANVLNGASPGDDWNAVVPTDRSSTDIVSSFVRDGENPPADTSYFTGGGSKDLNDVPAWAWTTGDVAPDKNEITNAYAVAYRATVDTTRNDVGDLLVYFGLDRYANNGDAQVGFWFFRSAVGLKTDGTFSGAHRTGDVLVLSHFTQGGSVSDVKVYAWVGSGGSDGALDLKVSAKSCAAAGANDPACAIVNQSNTPAAWTYIPKAGSANVFPSGSFYEGGLNVTRLVPGVTCFKSFMAETRSSQSVTAQLKDLVLGPFDTCPVTTSGPAGPARPAAPRIVWDPLPATGQSNMAPLAFLGLMMVMFGIGARGTAGRHMKLARDASASIAAARWFDATRSGCSAKGMVWPRSGPTRVTRGSRWPGRRVLRLVRRAAPGPRP